jgi:spermidine synthase
LDAELALFVVTVCRLQGRSGQDARIGLVHARKNGKLGAGMGRKNGKLGAGMGARTASSALGWAHERQARRGMGRTNGKLSARWAVSRVIAVGESIRAGQSNDTRPRIELIADTDHPGGIMLVMDAVRQSYVDLEDPTYLDFEYIQFFASVLSVWRDGPLATTHIGGGGLTMPRYLAVTRPGSPQIVLEPDVELTDLVRRELPLPRQHRIRIRPVLGQYGIAELADASADLVILDAYADGRVPAELTTLEFLTEVSRVLRADGLLLANVVDEPGLRYLRRVAAGMRAVFGDVVLVSSNDVLKGRRFGNLVLAASPAPLDVAALRREIVRQPFPAGVRDAGEVAITVGSALPWTVADSAESPEPNREGWRIR